MDSDRCPPSSNAHESEFFSTAQPIHDFGGKAL
jgi:hypothetical protein